MKKINTLLLTCFILAVSACSDFLKEDLQGTYSNATFYKTESQATLALTGVYNVASFIMTDNALWVFGDVASDDAVRGGKPGDLIDIQYIDDFNYSRNNGILDKMWKRYYEGISRANYLLYYGNGIDMDVALRDRLMGEAKFLRAYFYFSLVNIFGEIPLKLNPPLNDSELYKPKVSVSVVYEQIEKDLSEAAAVLSNSYTGADIGRATKGAAWGMLAKVYLYQAKWTEALNATAEVDAIGIYDLVQVYKNNFIDSTQNNIESIFEIQHLAGQSPLLGSYLNQYFSPVVYNGYVVNVPVENFIEEFEVTDEAVVDPRLDYTVGREGQPWVNGETYDPAWSPTGYLQKKHIQPLREGPVNNDGALNYVYMRYADILLIKAEALNELNRTSEALTPLNAVRKRARESYLYDMDLPGAGAVPTDLLPDVTNTGQLDVRVAIRHERRVELGFEFHRFFDLMRYGEVTAEAALEGTGFSYDKNRYFLIPQSELDTNPAIDQ
ncbi:MAG TPA: RagB/SusD family nutrient uptake outer membrane protein [Chryseolinea sp.]